MSERRRRVFMTAGLTASAAVLAMAVQAGPDEVTGGPSYGDSSASATEPAVEPVVEPDGAAGAEDE